MASTSNSSPFDIQRAEDRSRTELSWLDSKHSFSFGVENDDRDRHHGVLLVNNDDTVKPGAGFGTHPHRDMEIVTWVLGGSLVHQDSEGHSGVIYPGLAQRMSAGTGILHSERNDSWGTSGSPPHAEPARFIQMWVPPDESGINPSYEQLEIADEMVPGVMIPLASGMPKHRGESAIRIRNRYAALHVARLRGGQGVELPEAPFVHVFVAVGAVILEGAGPLREGDAVRITGAGGQRVIATPDAEILVWEMFATLQ
jgi:redox-sensitive bicupin YhaK (pirin superfamily)